MRIALGLGASAILMTSLSGCGPPEDHDAYACTKAGRSDADVLRTALATLSPNAGTFDDCDSGGSTGASIDPFSPGATLDSVEKAFAGRFDCDTPKRSREHGDDLSNFQCTIADVRADVGLDSFNGSVSAWVRPLE